MIPPQVGGTFALLLHELATNATKYGALSVPAGRVSISWWQEPGAVHFDWTEIGGPAVTPPARRGFGSRLLASAFPEDQAAVTIDYRADGVRCRISLIVPPEMVAGHAPAHPPPSPAEA